LDDLRWRRPFGMRCQLDVGDDPIDNFVVFDKGDHFHLSAALKAEERINFIDFFFISAQPLEGTWRTSSSMIRGWEGEPRQCMANVPNYL
jgi:hypothetical protein